MKRKVLSIMPKVFSNKIRYKYIFLGLLLLLTSCSNKSLKDKNESDYYINSTVNDSDINSNYENNKYNETENIKQNQSNISDVDEEVYKNILGSSILINKDDSEDFLEQLFDAYPEYVYSELFQIDKFLNKSSNLSKYDIENDSIGIINNNHIDVNELYNLVKFNNEEYIASNSGIASKYNGTTDSMILRVCNIIAEDINLFLENNVVDINLLEEKLNELKIFEHSTFSYAYYNSNTGILGLSTPTINAVKKTSGDQNAFEKIIKHEIKHILQGGTCEELNDNNISYDMRYGPCYKFKDLEVNSGYWNWYFEGAAEEMVTRDFENSSPLTYVNNVNLIKIIESIRILSGNSDINDFSNLSLNENINNFYSYFNCATDDDKKDIINMMYSLNIIYQDDSNSSTVDFYTQYKKSYGQNMSYGDRTKNSKNFMASVSQTLTRIFYRDLIKNMEGNIKVEDIFAKIYLLEHQLGRLTQYYYNSSYEYNEEFFKYYVSIQDDFFDILASNLNVSVDSIKGSYYMYFTQNYSNKEVVSSTFNSEKRDYLINELSKGYRTRESIGEVYYRNYVSNIKK